MRDLLATISISDYFTKFTIIFGVITGTICGWLGGYDILLKTVISLTILDFITGVGKNLFNGCGISSEYGFRGIIKKIFIYLTIAVSVIIGKFIGTTIPIREVVITFYIINEGLSIIENIGEVIPYPDKLKNILSQLKDGDTFE